MRLAWYVYILKCEPNALYTGSTPNPDHRLRQHLSRVAGGAKFTRSHPPKALAALWRTPDAHAAHSLEWHIKRLTPAKKRALVAAPDAAFELLGACAEGAEPLDTEPYRHHFTDLS